MRACGCPTRSGRRTRYVVTVNERNAVHTFKLAPGAGPLFAGIKGDDRARIKETAVDAAVLLPDGAPTTCGAMATTPAS